MKLKGLLTALFVSLCLTLPLKAAEMVNINTAHADQIAEVLTGIGPAKAKAIVAHREQYGPFKTVDNLVDVKGIGKATVSKNLNRILVSDPDAE